MSASETPVAPDRLTLHVLGMSCANCATRLERVLNRRAGVDARVDFATERAIIHWPRDYDRDEIFVTIRKAGFDAEIEGVRALREAGTRPAGRPDLSLMLLAICVVPFLLSMLAMSFGRHDLIPDWLEMAIASFVQLVLAQPFYRRAWAALRHGDANMDVLVVLSTTITYLFSAWNLTRGRHGLYFESSVFIIFFVSLGKWFEARAKALAANDLKVLLTDQPSTVRVEKDGALHDRPISSLCLGDIFVLRPGDPIAVDGEVVNGESEVNEALLTGESQPVYRAKGDKVFAGTVNLDGMLRVRALRLGEETVVAQMGEFVKNAQMSRARISTLVDRVTRVFVPTILLIAIAVFVLRFFLSGQFEASIVPAIAVMVIACPCALGLATPAVLMVAGGRAARIGIFFRNVAVLERAAETDTIVFDKTGTLTRGQFNVSDLIVASGITEETLLTTLLAVENHAEHPLAKAIANHARSRGAIAQEVASFKILPGRGVSAVRDGTLIQACSPAYLMQQGYTLPQNLIEKLEGEGKTTVAVVEGDAYLGLIALEDVLRPEAEATVRVLTASHIVPHVLTGDNAPTAQRLADQLNISQVRAGILPEGKADYIEALIKKGHIVAMVGDGVNDAPALATADVSIAMGSAAGVSMAQSDIILLRNHLDAVNEVFILARATLGKIRSNLGFAFLYNVCAIPLAAFGYLTPAIAAAAMALSSVSVVLNALLLRGRLS